MSSDVSGAPGAERALAHLMAASRASVVARVRALAAAARTAGDGTDDTGELHREAHKIAGTAGMVGLPAVGEVALELESLLADDPRALAAHGPRLAAGLLRALDVADAEPAVREQRVAAAEGGGHAAAAHEPHRRDRTATVLLALSDRSLAADIAAAAQRRGLRAARVAGEPRLAPPDVVLVDLDDGDDPAANAVIREAAAAGTPVVALASGRDTALRVHAVHAGVTEILDRSLPVDAVVEALHAQVEAPPEPRSTVLVVDDDPVVVEAISLVLREDPIDVLALGDPARFWEVLTEARPDLVVLDVNMPQFSGVELCRAARLDPRSRALPIVFLSASGDADTVREVFGAGADDFVVKPFVGPELRARIVSRIDRLRLHRRLAETDGLTGLPNRRKLEDSLETLTTTGAGEPFVLAVLDVDRFKNVNDEHGHDVGDRALQELGRHLDRRFRRGGDLTGRIGGEEFVVAIPGGDVEASVRRLAWVLGDFRRHGIACRDGVHLHIAISGGVARFPEHGGSFHELYRAADEALRAAKTGGRRRLVECGSGAVHMT